VDASFVDQDLEATPFVAVINQAAARTYWPGKDGKGEDPVGKRVHLLGRLGRTRPDWTTIVGVIADARTESLADAGIPQIYLDIYQRPAKFLAFYLRGQVDPAAISAQVRTKSSPSMRSFPSSARRPWTTFSPLRFLCGGSPWKWWRCLPPLPAPRRPGNLWNHLLPGQ